MDDRPIAVHLTRSIALFAFVSVWAATHTASAQDSDSSREQARVEFVAGTEAATEGRWADSLQHFEQAYVLSGVPTALFNAAMALRALGRQRDARDAFDRLMSQHPDTDAAADAHAIRDEVAARIAVLELTGLDPSGDYALRLDGQRVEPNITTVTEIESDPGHRAIVAERAGYESWAWEGDLSDGQRLRLDVTMAERVTESTSIFKSPVFWIITGIVLAGGAAALTWYLVRAEDLQPTHMNFLVVP